MNKLNSKVLLNLFTITACAFFVSYAFVVMLNPGHIQFNFDSNDVDDQVGIAKKSVKLNAYNIITKRNLFNAFDASNVPPPPKPKPQKQKIIEIPVTKRVRLIGTIYSNDEGLRRAIIDEKGQQLKKIGDKVAGMTIADIRRRGVVLKKGNKEELLLVDGSDKQIVLESDSGPVLLPKKEVMENTRNIEDVLASVDFSLDKKGDKTGIMIKNIDKDSILNSFGLQKGDLIVSVDGKKMDSMKSIMNMKSFANADGVVLEIFRNGRIEVIDVRLR